VLLLPVQSVKVLTLSSLLRCLRCVFAWNFGRLVEGLLYFLVFPCVEVFPLVKWSPGFFLNENGQFPSLINLDSVIKLVQSLIMECKTVSVSSVETFWPFRHVPVRTRLNSGGKRRSLSLRFGAS